MASDKVPGLNLNPRGMTPMSTQRSRMSAMSTDSTRLEELAEVKRELEEALRQVKEEMRAGGATRSEVGSSCSSRSRSVASSSRCSTVVSPRSSRCGTSRSRMKTPKPSSHSKEDQPLVSRPSKQSNVLPCPTPGAFKPKQFVTNNQQDFIPLDHTQNVSKNQGPQRGKNKKEISFSKFAENQVNTSSLLSSKVMAS